MQPKRAVVDKLFVPRHQNPPSWPWPWTSISAAELGLSSTRGRAYELVGIIPPRPRLAIVGSRAAHRRVLRCLEPIVAAAAARGWSLISGGALGVDGGAHRAALELGVPQLAVLPCGRDILYPPGHAGLFAQLAEAGNAGLLFTHPPGTPTVRAMFASRNAIVVGLADAVLVAEAGLRSGSRGTGRLALRRELPLAAIAGSPGCGALIGAGAWAIPAPPPGDDFKALACTTEAVARWLERLTGDGAAEPEPSSSWPEHLRWLEAALCEAGPSGLAIDALPEPLAHKRVALALCEAELLGLVCEAAAGRWVAV